MPMDSAARFIVILNFRFIDMIADVITYTIGVRF